MPGPTQCARSRQKLRTAGLQPASVYYTGQVVLVSCTVTTPGPAEQKGYVVSQEVNLGEQT